MGKLHRIGVITALALLGFALRSPAYGGISATSTISSVALSASSFEYSLTLTNTGTTPIGTFWFAWEPLYNLLPTAPTSVSSPAGWNGAPGSDFYGVPFGSVQWIATTPLQPGNTISGFKFDSPDSPNTLSANSIYGPKIEFSYVYIGAPETDPGAFLTPTAPTPEPGTLALLMLPAAFVLRRKRR
jgi:hypothetical protein